MKVTCDITIIDDDGLTHRSIYTSTDEIISGPEDQFVYAMVESILSLQRSIPRPMRTMASIIDLCGNHLSEPSGPWREVNNAFCNSAAKVLAWWADYDAKVDAKMKEAPEKE